VTTRTKPKSLIPKAAVKNTGSAELAPGDRTLYVESAHTAPRTDHAEYPDFSAASRGPENEGGIHTLTLGSTVSAFFPTQLARLSIYALPSAASSADQSQHQTPALLLPTRTSGIGTWPPRPARLKLRPCPPWRRAPPPLATAGPCHRRRGGARSRRRS
jgi:hypothetical protein